MSNSWITTNKKKNPNLEAVLADEDNAQDLAVRPADGLEDLAGDGVQRVGDGHQEDAVWRHGRLNDGAVALNLLRRRVVQMQRLPVHQNRLPHRRLDAVLRPAQGLRVMMGRLGGGEDEETGNGQSRLVPLLWSCLFVRQSFRQSFRSVPIQFLFSAHAAYAVWQFLSTSVFLVLTANSSRAWRMRGMQTT